MLPANLAKARASTSTRAASYGEFILIPTMSGVTHHHASPAPQQTASIRYTPYAIPLSSSGSGGGGGPRNTQHHHILSTLEHGLAPYMTTTHHHHHHPHHKNLFGVIAAANHHGNVAHQAAGITINHPTIGLTMLPIQTVGI